MKFVSFNINSIRARPHQLQTIVEKHAPDIIGLQETKAQDADFPFDYVESLGYKAIVCGQKAHHGVAILVKETPHTTIIGFPADSYLNAQARLVHIVFQKNNKNIHVINGYFPQGENASHPDKFPFKRAFYAALTARIADLRRDANNELIVMGDMNIAPHDLDIGIGEINKKRWLQAGKCSFLPEEREWMETILAAGDLVDSYRVKRPSAQELSWFDYRSKGFEDEPRRGLRIDLVLVSQGLSDLVLDVGIDYDIRAMEKPSDHAPVWAHIDCCKV